MLEQLQNRLLQLSTQLDQVQSRLDQLADDAQHNNGQIDALAAHLLNPQVSSAIYERLSELAAHLETQSDHLSTLQSAISGVANQQVNQQQVRKLEQTLTTLASQSQVDALTQQLLPRLATLANQEQVTKLEQTLTTVASQSQVDQLLQQLGQQLAGVANQEQIGQLERALTETVASRETVESLSTALQKLTRTQFKTNTLSESKEQQVESALATLRELGSRRTQMQERQNALDQARIETLRSEARGNLAADLLPAIDSLELAIDNGQRLHTRYQQQIKEQHEAHVDAEAGWRAAVAQTQRLRAKIQADAEATLAIVQPKGFWSRLFGGEAQNEISVSATPTLPDFPEKPGTPVGLDFASDMLHSIEAWLTGLDLVRQRFSTLLAGEQVRELDALNQPFDPRLHVAIEAETRQDVPAHSVVRVLRKGYAQRQRVLRYAEVVVSRMPPANKTSESTAQTQPVPVQPEQTQPVQVPEATTRVEKAPVHIIDVIDTGVIDTGVIDTDVITNVTTNVMDVTESERSQPDAGQ